MTVKYSILHNCGEVNIIHNWFGTFGRMYLTQRGHTWCCKDNKDEVKMTEQLVEQQKIKVFF